MKAQIRVTASPLPALGMPLRRPGRFAERLEAFTSLHDLGRSAIYWACRGLRLAPGTRIWMPALHCGVEVQAALDSGLNVGFYRLDEELNVDEEDLERKLQNQPSVVFIIHYFGFAQSSIERLASLCRNHGSVLIEDCGHALLSKYRGRELGGFAPISTFSLRKSLPIPDGGALSVNAELLQLVTKTPFEQPPLGEVSIRAFFGYPKSVARASLGARVVEIYRRLSLRGAVEQDRTRGPDANLPSTRPYVFGMSTLSRRAAASAEPSWIFEQRRRNYLALDDALLGSPGYRRVFGHLSDDVCPLFLPIWVADREPLKSVLQGRGVETFRFGAVPHPRLDVDMRLETASLRDNILCLPVHQQLTRRDVAEMSRIVRPLLADHSFRQKTEEKMSSK